MKNRKLELSEMLEPAAESDGLPLLMQALSDRFRLQILVTLLRAEANDNHPVSYTAIMESFRDKGLASNKLAYHLAKLQEAGLVRHLVAPSERAPLAEKALLARRSYYETTAMVPTVIEGLGFAQRTGALTGLLGGKA